MNDKTRLDLHALEREVMRLAETFAGLKTALRAVILGQDEVINHVLFGVAAGGHVLLEGAPGLGKTLLVKAMAAAMDLREGRVQFTPDLMPADITGTFVIEEVGRALQRRFQPGPVFTNVLLADEINRATPKTQSALLEAMQERTVTIAGDVMPLPSPFFVLATQNPIEMEGTYPLPEAQLDRFLLKIEVPFPRHEDLVQVLARTTSTDLVMPLPILDAEALTELQRRVRDVVVPMSLLEHAARLVLATHPEGDEAPAAVREGVRYGASPRGAQALILTAKARALSQGRVQIGFEDFDAVLHATLRHRIILSFQAEAQGLKADAILDEVVRAIR